MSEGAKLDLLIHKEGKRLGYAIKYTSAPKLTKSMRIAMENLKLNSLSVIYPGEINYPLAKDIQVVSFSSFANSLMD